MGWLTCDQVLRTNRGKWDGKWNKTSEDIASTLQWTIGDISLSNITADSSVNTLTS